MGFSDAHSHTSVHPSAGALHSAVSPSNLAEDPTRVGLPYPGSLVSIGLDNSMPIPASRSAPGLGLARTSSSLPHRPNSSATSRGNDAGFLAPDPATFHQQPAVSASLSRGHGSSGGGSSGASGSPSSGVKENTGRWTMEEHNMFLEGLKLHGKGWKQIAQMIKTRTVVQIRTHAQKYFQKLAKAQQNGNTTGEVTMDTRGGPATSSLPIPIPKGGGASSSSSGSGLGAAAASHASVVSGHGAAGGASSGAAGNGKKRKKSSSKRKSNQASLDGSEPSSGRRKVSSGRGAGSGGDAATSKRLAINISKLKSSISSPSPSSIMDVSFVTAGSGSAMPPELFPRDAGVEMESFLVDTAALDWLASDGQMVMTSSSGSSSSMSESSGDDTSDSERDAGAGSLFPAVESAPFGMEPGLDLMEQTMFDPTMDDEAFVSAFLGDSDWP